MVDPRLEGDEQARQGATEASHVQPAPPPPVKGPEAEMSLSYSRKREKTSGQDGKMEGKTADGHGEPRPFPNAVSYTHRVS